MAPQLIMRFLSKAICCSKLKTLYICNLLSHWALSNYCDPLWDIFHTPMIKITYTPHIFANFYTGSYARTFHPSFHIIPQNKNSMIFMTTLSKLSFQEKGHGLCKKKRDMLKKVWWKKRVGHMKVQVFKKNRELDTWRSKSSKKDREIAHVQRKRNKGERWFMNGVHTPSIQIFTHMHILI